MNAKQEAKLNMFRATQKHCNDNPTIVATVPAFTTTLTAFNSKVSAIIPTAQQEDLVTKGITVDKTRSKENALPVSCRCCRTNLRFRICRRK